MMDKILKSFDLSEFSNDDMSKILEVLQKDLLLKKSEEKRLK